MSQVFGRGADGDVEISVPEMAHRKFSGDSTGLKGSGTFDFEVVGRRGGTVKIKLENLTFSTENKADKSYRDLVGQNVAPAGLNDDLDDGTDVV